MERTPRTVGFHRGRLPHWEVEDGHYFVTIRLAGSIPAQAARRLRAMARGLQGAPDTECVKLERQIFAELERWLDAGTGPCHLADDGVARMVMDAIAHRVEQGIWDVYAYVIMPNHVHLFFLVLAGSMYETVRDFKKWTARHARGMLDTPRGAFWQRECFDHWSRSDEEDQRTIEYIRNNPVKAGLVQQSEAWPCSSWHG